jgi:pimeloyl-ACP methyl ester carboxylesterase
MAEIEHLFYKTNGIWLHTAAAGPQEGRLIIFLHGFPEFWYGWSEQIPFFAGEGFRVLAPDQRGYNISDRPKGIRSYNEEELVRDVVGLIEAAGREEAVIVGHDWGGAVAWWLAKRYPERVEKLVILNAPHWVAMAEDLSTNLAQLVRSLYIGFFQLPRIPEWLCSMGNWRLTARALRRTSLPRTFSRADINEYKRAWSQPGAFTTMLNWYRAVFRYPPQRPEDPYINVPTLILWGQHDAFLGSELARSSQNMCTNSRLVLIHNATHWVHKEKPEQVNNLIRSFLLSE